MQYIQAASKEQLRCLSLDILKKQAKANNYAIDKKINKRLNRIIFNSKAKNLLVYLPLKLEVDIIPLIKKLRQKKIKVFVPFVQDISFKMVPFRLPLKRGRFNLQNAGSSFQSIKKIDIALVPALGIDANFKRIGFGKGMYDRFFAAFTVPLIIFVQRIACIGKNIVTDEFDSMGDLLVSAQKNYIQGFKKDDSRIIRISGAPTIGGNRFFSGKKNRPSQIRYLHRAIKIKS